MKRARKKKTSTSKQVVNPSCFRGKKRHTEEKEDSGMGGTVSSQDDPPKLENPTSLECTNCSSILKPAVFPAGGSTSLLQCPQCSTTPLCGGCLYPCPDGTCTNKSCPVVSLLLACEQVTELSSKVYGCPLFRACPKCYRIMMHKTGCKYVTCSYCNHSYCFICLRSKQVCTKDMNKYWSLTCSAPKAARQRFQT
ncbi:hypothetical protein Q7C36_022850 [Tachysurus vachellii]|uniref:RBR-type E3 ubiquitin transferase n=1 Tax=Tachysurus vachellii TaxID=175792 RepID=A0AA88J154_TACVA|nr:hypothetical protein Q7C36_022850 [Tachysurus vachellii]